MEGAKFKEQSSRTARRALCSDIKGVRAHPTPKPMCIGSKPMLTALAVGRLLLRLSCGRVRAYVDHASCSSIKDAWNLAFSAGDTARSGWIFRARLRYLGETVDGGCGVGGTCTRKLTDVELVEHVQGN